MGNVVKTISAKLAFKQFQPTLEDIAKLVKSAPVHNEHERSGLAMMIASHAFGTAAAVLAKDLNKEVDVRAVAEAIVYAINRKSSEGA